MDDKDANFESRPTTTDAVPPLSPFPEGGWRAWSVLLGVYVFFLLNHGINIQFLFSQMAHPILHFWVSFPAPLFRQFHDVTMLRYINAYGVYNG